MRNKVVTVYRFRELSASAKERAKSDYAASGGGWGWDDEAYDSISALATYFGGRIIDYQVDYANCGPSHMTFSMPELETDDTVGDVDTDWVDAKLAALGAFDPNTLKGVGECKLTGYCLDEDAIDGFRASWLANYDLDAAMQAAFQSWLAAAQDDYAGFYEDDYFAEHCDANELEFYDNGELA